MYRIVASYSSPRRAARLFFAFLLKCSYMGERAPLPFLHEAEFFLLARTALPVLSTQPICETLARIGVHQAS